MRSLDTIQHDKDRLQKQMCATMNSTTMSATDIRITLEGFSIQKVKLDAEYATTQAIRNTEVKDPITLPNQS